MALSARTLIREKLWTKLIRGMEEGEHLLPGRMAYDDYFSFKSSCFRENRYATGYLYKPSISDGKVTVIKTKSTGL